MRIRLPLGSALCISLLVAQPSSAQTIQYRDAYLFATRTFGPWRADAVSRPTDTTPPRVASVQCTIEGPAFDVTVSNSGRAEIQLGRIDDRAIGWALDSFAIDGRHYESALQPYISRSRFIDVEYPPEPQPEYFTGDIPGYLGFRHRASDPWLSLADLVSELVNSRVVSIGYKYWGSPDNREMHATAKVRMVGLAKAVKWCQETVKSPEAYTLHLLHRPPEAG